MRNNLASQVIIEPHIWCLDSSFTRDHPNKIVDFSVRAPDLKAQAAMGGRRSGVKRRAKAELRRVQILKEVEILRNSGTRERNIVGVLAKKIESNPSLASLSCSTRTISNILRSDRMKSKEQEA